VVCAQHAWLSPLPPEGAAAILHRDTGRAPEMAQSQGVRSRDLLRTGVVDRIVPEEPDAADEPAEFLGRLATVLEHEITGLLLREPAERLAARLARYRRLGSDA
jgi:acetyl-CoA carboxylase carboxyl transferase subunit beta